MTNKILIKGSNTSSEVPSSLTQGSDDGNNDAATEIAINRADGKLYYLNNSDSVTAGELSDTTYAAGAGVTIAGGANTITISADSLTEAMLDVSNGPTNGYALTAQSGAGGGLTWADISSGGVPTHITLADESSNATCFVMFATESTGDREPKTGTNLTFNSSTGVLTASGLRGDLVGDVTGTASLSTLAASATVLATARTVAGVSFNGSANISLNNNAITNGAGYTTNTGTTTASNSQTFTNKIWNGTAIASGYIAGDAITGAKIADNAIDSEHYTDGSIDNAHIADNAINSEHYADGSIDNAHIADNAINSEHYAADSIDAEHYAAGSVDATALGADCVTAAKIGDNVINSEHYAAGSIDNEHIADDAVNSEHYAAGSIDQAHLADQVVNEAKMQISNGPTNG